MQQRIEYIMVNNYIIVSSVPGKPRHRVAEATAALAPKDITATWSHLIHKDAQTLLLLYLPRFGTQTPKKKTYTVPLGSAACPRRREVADSLRVPHRLLSEMYLHIIYYRTEPDLDIPVLIHNITLKVTKRLELIYIIQIISSFKHFTF